MRLLDEHELDAVLITNGTNRRYLTGFTAEDHAPDESSGVVVVARDSTVLFTSPTNLPWASAEAHAGVSVLPATRPWTDGVATWARERTITRLGFEDATTTVAAFAALTGSLPGVELIPVGGGTDAPRRIKQPDELEALEVALGMTDRAFVRASERLREGMTEIDLADVIREALRNEGSDGEAFPTIVASGPNAAKPHHAPGDRRIAQGEPVIIDMGARHRGYCGDLTRTIWLGQPPPQLGTMYRLVLDAQAAAIAIVRAGIDAPVVDRTARDVFAAAGMAESFLHSVGHGLGLRVHEAPWLNQASSDILESGNVVTIEPGLYVPEWGGVRIEDVLLVEEHGARNLTGAPKRAV